MTPEDPITMTMRIEVLGEPNLRFGNDREYPDPKVGILNFGPSGWSDTTPGGYHLIRAGAIGTLQSVTRLRTFLERLHQRIAPGSSLDSRPWLVDFPGIGSDSPFRFDIALEEDKVEIIDGREEASVLGQPNRSLAIGAALHLYEDKLEQLAATSVSQPELVFLPLSSDLIQRCKDPNALGERIVAARRTLDTESDSDEPEVLDFHNVLKILGFRRSLSLQVLRPATLRLEGSQDPATIAWNLCVAIYYKGTGNPWKLAALDADTCHVGVSFCVVPGVEPEVRASLAQVYVRTGESQVILGTSFKWDRKQGKQPSLTETLASELLTKALARFDPQNRRAPRRVVVHKSSPFTLHEVAGFERAAARSESIDLVHISSYSPYRGLPVDNDYPPIRGTLIHSMRANTSLLYSQGFVPALNTYPGSTIPGTLRLEPARMDSDSIQVAKDVLALTKLDWNTSSFATIEPVTISVARRVGAILSETKARGIDPPEPYRYYM